MKIISKIAITFFTLILVIKVTWAQRSCPNLIITEKDVIEIKNSLGMYPLFDKAFNEAKEIVEQALALPIDVPIPKDAGGYTHDRHKKNYNEMQLAGILYSVTKDERYANFIKTMLLKYADIYPKLKDHPMKASNSPGRLFWQTLNETVWLVHTSQAYDCIYDWLNPKDRKTIEEKVLRPMARFLSEERADDVDKIHNHGTWACAAIGMAGYAIGDKDLVEKALYGTKKNKEGGYLRQLELLFSPDGFYKEGPYYIRYASLPFFSFAQVIENNQPEIKIFEYRNQILKKAFYSAMQLTYTNGAFIPFNDAMKEKNYLSPEIVVALNITYRQYGEDPQLLSIAAKHNTVMLSGAGLSVAKALSSGLNVPEFQYSSVEYRDGADGDEGGVGILRCGPNSDQSLLLMKYTSHGMSHGHYDKLSFLYYDQGYEIIQDYGAVRFMNVESKFGGRYLPENQSWAMQTIAHNTVTVDEKSHFDGKAKISERYHPDRYYFSASDPNLQIMSARVTDTYKGVEFHRTMAMIKDETFNKPIIIDVFKVDSKNNHQYDLPFYYIGHLINTNVKYVAHDKQRTVMGKSNGYQHLWNEAQGKADGSIKFSWLLWNRYYSVVSAADTTTEVYFVRIGASDPNFNLRHEPGIIIRQKADSHIFASVIEPHGKWDGIKEFSIDASGKIESVNVLLSNDNYTAVNIGGKNNLNWILILANKDSSDSTVHSVDINGIKYEWIGPYKLVK